MIDPDARAMARMTKVGVGYNIQLAVDVKHKLIAEQEVHNQVLDMGLLAPTVEAAMDTLGVERIEAVADRGYFKIEGIEACEKAGITAFVPKPIRGPAVAQRFFSKEEFRYDPDKDIYLCAENCLASPPASRISDSGDQARDPASLTQPFIRTAERLCDANRSRTAILPKSGNKRHPPRRSRQR